jgi:predicted ribosomally synthesized peptide with SipW-like signal peptide
MRHAAQKRSAGKRLPFLRARALLAGGLVLGLGATVTAASWNDSEYATATLSTSTFNTESNVNALGYVDAPTAPGTTVTLPVGAFSPNVKGYLQVLIRTKANSIAGTVVLNPGVVTGSGPNAAADALAFTQNFSYRVVRTTTTCNDQAFLGSPVWVVGTAGGGVALNTGQTGGVNVLAAATPTLPGSATGFCFEVLLSGSAPNDLQGKSAAATWQFLATSN